MTEERAGLPILAFSDLATLEQWLEAQPASSPGLWIKFAKAGSGLASVSKGEAIDAALCHGWIDGQLDKYDDTYWLTRFTPRKARGKWSQVNRTRAAELIEAGRIARADWRRSRRPAPTADGMRPTRPRAGPKCRPIFRPRSTRVRTPPLFSRP